MRGYLAISHGGDRIQKAPLDNKSSHEAWIPCCGDKVLYILGLPHGRASNQWAVPSCGIARL